MIAVILSDQLSKWWVMTVFVPHETRVVVPGFFNLTYITNTGAAFGLFAGDHGVIRQVFFVSAALAALVALAYLFIHYRSKDRFFVCGIGLIAGGAVGNMVDRLRFGEVVDFLDFYINKYHWPAFNVADAAICIGVGLFMLGNVRDAKKEE